MSLQLDRLQSGHPYVDPKSGAFTMAFVIYWLKTIEALETQEAQQDALIAEQAAQLVLIQAAQAELAAQQAELAAQLLLIQQAQADADSANSDLADIAAGVFETTGVFVGGQRFVNDAGTLVPE